MPDVDFHRFDALTFDCYGTLIDWEAGILAALRAVLDPRAVEPGDDELLERYRPARGQRSRTGRTCATATCSAGRSAACARISASSRPTQEMATFSASVGEWPAFPDSAEALARLHGRFKLGRHHQLRRRPVRPVEPPTRRRPSTGSSRRSRSAAYKPDPANFELRLRADRCAPRADPPRRPEPLPRPRPAPRRCGMSTAWIDRRHDKPGFGATPACGREPGRQRAVDGRVRRPRPGLRTAVRDEPAISGRTRPGCSPGSSARGSQDPARPRRSAAASSASGARTSASRARPPAR